MLGRLSLLLVAGAGSAGSFTAVIAVATFLFGAIVPASNALLQRNYTAGVVIFEMDAVVPIEELSEALVLDPPKEMKFQVLEVAAGKINLKAVAE